MNGIQDFRSIRFMRIVPAQAGSRKRPCALRAWNSFVANGASTFRAWKPPVKVIGGDPDPTTFQIAAVNIEENGNRTPINYVLPPGINKEVDVASANLRNLNEQSLQMKVCNLRDGDARAGFRNVQFDIRSYKKMRMYIHAESSDPN